MQLQPSTKEQALSAIRALPDNTTFEEMMYRLYVLEKINTAQNAITDNKTISLDALRKETETW